MIIAAAFIYFSGCKEEEKVIPQKPSMEDSIRTADSLKALKEKEIEISYHFLPIASAAILDSLKEQYGEEGKKIILSLNRIDSRNLIKGDSLIIPDTVFNSLMPYTPFPKELSIADSIQKLLIFSYPVQAFGAYEKGRLVYWGPTSLGKKSTPTPTGLFHTNWKARVTRSTVDSSWILPWAFNLENFQGVSLHQFDMPGYPASHACARLLEEDAKWIYYWAKQWILNNSHSKIIGYGTPVIIYGDYDFKDIPPWKKLAQDKDVTKISEDELREIVELYLKKILQRQTVRDSIDAARAMTMNDQNDHQ